MKRLLFLLPVWLLVTSSCEKTGVDVPDCKPPLEVTIDGACVTPQEGVRLTATDYRVSAGSQFEWHIYAFKNRESVNLIMKNQWASFSNQDTFLVPGSVLKDNSVLVVEVLTFCNGKRLSSLGFIFEKTTAANQNCGVWRKAEP